MAVFSPRPTRRVKSEKAALRLQRRRHGTTSPPLDCIEENPGPKRKATRKSGKLSSNFDKRTAQLTQEEKEEIKQRWLNGESTESIIKALPHNKNTIVRCRAGKQQSCVFSKPRAKRGERIESV